MRDKAFAAADVPAQTAAPARMTDGEHKARQPAHEQDRKRHEALEVSFRDRAGLGAMFHARQYAAMRKPVGLILCEALIAGGFRPKRRG
ncbi:MAG: hypothetical protein BroJett013_29330 [Alphaproteobacteria bacterium]|nr:MAG: hypothetical protein BroJett013_29330 [Alphaproteobacteria bacterium]